MTEFNTESLTAGFNVTTANLRTEMRHSCIPASTGAGGGKVHLLCFLTCPPCHIVDGPDISKHNITMGAGVGTCIMEEETISGQLRPKDQIP